LLVDEEDSLRIVMAKALRRRGFSILSAANALTAVDAFRNHAGRIDALVLDLKPPNASNLETLKQIRQVMPDVQVILTSAHPWNSGDGAFAEFAPVAFLRKPYRIDVLARALWQALNGASPRRERAATAPHV
jgi:DNA-binding NtrC family response regulator